jgi:hypothetical protein
MGMIRAAILGEIAGGGYPVVNVVNYADDATLPAGTVECPDWVSAPDAEGRCCTFADGEFAAPEIEPEPPAVPAEITRRQLITGMVSDGLITAQEALDAAQSGAVPAAIDAAFGTLPSDQALAARIAWATMTAAERAHPLVALVGAAFGLSEAAIDDRFRAWALL